MTNLNVRDVPETVADGLAEIARELGMSREAYARKLFTDAVMEAGYHKLAQDAEYIEYQRARRESRGARAARRAAREDGDAT